MPETPHPSSTPYLPDADLLLGIHLETHLSLTMSTPRMSHDQFPVAVLFAMKFEMTAFRHMLDEEYTNHLPRRQGDQNSYILGRLGAHNVVLAWLPGEQGVGAAAVVGSNLLRTFPNISWRILVGIG